MFFVTSVGTLNIVPTRIYKLCFVTGEGKSCRSGTGNYFFLPSFPSLFYSINLPFPSCDPRYDKALNDTHLLHGAESLLRS
jgi:hypothetical protein